MINYGSGIRSVSSESGRKKEALSDKYFVSASHRLGRGMND